MPKNRPVCTISLRFKSGRKFRVDLFRSRLLPGRKRFEVKFTDHDGEVRNGSANVTKVIDRLRRLIVKEI